jgi:hypothetical protein
MRSAQPAVVISHKDKSKEAAASWRLSGAADCKRQRPGLWRRAGFPNRGNSLGPLHAPLTPLFAPGPARVGAARRRPRSWPGSAAAGLSHGCQDYQERQDFGDVFGHRASLARFARAGGRPGRSSNRLFRETFPQVRRNSIPIHTRVSWFARNSVIRALEGAGVALLAIRTRGPISEARRARDGARGSSLGFQPRGRPATARDAVLRVTQDHRFQLFHGP